MQSRALITAYRATPQPEHTPAKIEEPHMAGHLPRRIAIAVLALGMAAGAAVMAAAPASATSARPADSGPAPICWPFPVICVPQAWFVVSNVITNDGLLQLLPTSTEANTTTVATQMSQTVTVSGSLTATVTGNIGVPGSSIAAVTPGGQASVSGSDAVQGFVNIPPGDIGSLQFGIIYIQENGTVFFRNVNGQVTSSPQVATVPEGFGYIASVTPIINGAASSHRTAVITAR
jgi:hypothetical protein